MAMAINDQWLAGQLPLLALHPRGIWGISYDVFTRPTEDPVPIGWQARRSQTYRELLRRLRDLGYNHHQYSDHCKFNVAASEAFMEMIGLVGIQPPSKLPTTIKGLKMHYIDNLALFDVSDEVMLGGNVATHLLGPSPRLLVQRLLANGPNLNPPPAPVQQGDPGVPPKYTKRTPNTMNAANYLG